MAEEGLSLVYHLNEILSLGCFFFFPPLPDLSLPYKEVFTGWVSSSPLFPGPPPSSGSCNSFSAFQAVS